MRIISVATLFSPDGAYGGPTRVAVNQAAQLRALGHEVIIAAGARGYDRPPEHIEGVPVRLFPARTAVPGAGFAGLASPGLHRWLRRAMPGADVVHVHAARDLITLPAATLARRLGVPYVLQTHGMIDRSSRLLSRPVDRALTRPVLHGAGAVLYLTPRERRDLLAVSGTALPLVEMLNGVPVPPGAATVTGSEVLFLARLHARKRPTFFVRMAHRLHDEFPDARFSLVGPDEGEGAVVARLIAGSAAPVTWEGPLAPEDTLARMAQAAVYVLPSIDEPFPMSVLEAMALGRPVVVTESCGLAPLIRDSGSGIVTDEGLDALVDAVRALLADPTAARRMGEAGAALTRERLSIDAVAGRLVAVYGEVRETRSRLRA
ncbi:glycosyltransferase [Georgenia sp. SYP-B2076]|uniref:glycosyltransferase n=1 Tax=Georgenia sp. SYP-B2076 TaxID=2495881 RepID=UPI000F8C9B0E|nr:glycosyltransferase [Georgenia sp. SYP-B2076]